VPFPIVLTKPNTVAFGGVVKGGVDVEVVLVQVGVEVEVEDVVVVLFHHPPAFEKYRADTTKAIVKINIMIAFFRLSKANFNTFIVILF
jgi:hypothetical protein